MQLTMPTHGIWIREAESAKFWLSVLNEIKNRGVKEILVISVMAKGIY